MKHVVDNVNDPKFYEWAKGGTKADSILKALVADADVISTIRQEAESDEENESAKLLNMYHNASDEEKAIMDSVLVTICGWTMESIIEMTPMDNISFAGLKKAFNNFNTDGRYTVCGNWSIASGGYDCWWEIYYKGYTVLQCINGKLEGGFRPFDDFTEETEKQLIKYVKNIIGINEEIKYEY